MTIASPTELEQKLRIEKILFVLATIDDPSWSFKPKWISDTELEYYLPNDERKIYKIKE